jgi:hypothetical protein
MNTASKRVVLLFSVAATFVLFAACEEALTGVDTDEGVPSTDGTNTPFVEIQTGNKGEVLNDFRTIPGVFEPQVLTVQPNFAVGEEITVDYEVSGPAEDGDFIIDSPNPITIPGDSIDSGLESANIVVVRGAGNLTTEPTSLDVTLTNLSTDGDTEVQLGRAGEDIGRTRTIGIEPSVFLLETAPNIDTTEVGASSFAIGVTQNVSVAPFTVQNLSISGPDADEFSVVGASPEGDPATIQAPPVDVNPLAVTLVAAQFGPESAGEKEATLSYELTNSMDTETYEISLSAVAEENGGGTSATTSASAGAPTGGPESLSKKIEAGTLSESSEEK